MKLTAPIIALNLLTQLPLPLFSDPDWSSLAASTPPIPEESAGDMTKIIEDAARMETLQFLQSNATLGDKLSVAESVLNMTEVQAPDITAGGLLDDWEQRIM